MKRIAAPLLCLFLAARFATAATTSADRLAEGKLKADLGEYPAAEKVFADLAVDSKASDRDRAEAQVRLGVVARALGKTKASADAFERAMANPGRDAEVTRLVVLAVAGVVPDEPRWAREWPKVRLVTANGHPMIEWPEAGTQRVRDFLRAKDPVTMDLDAVPIRELLFYLFTTGVVPRHAQSPVAPPKDGGFEKWPATYTAPVAVGAVDVLLHAGVEGTVTIKATNMAWSDLVNGILASNGLSGALDETLKMVFIAPRERLNAFDRARAHKFARIAPVGVGMTLFMPDAKLGTQEGPAVTFVVGNNAIAGSPIITDDGVRGRLTMRLRDREALQVFDLMLAANDLGLSWMKPKANGNRDLRLSRLADIQGDAIDISTIPMRRAGFSLWTVAVDGNSGQTHGDPSQLTIQATPNGIVHGLSDDGRLLVFESWRRGKPDIWLRDSMTGAETRLSDSPAPVEGRPPSQLNQNPVISHDGKTVYYWKQEFAAQMQSSSIESVPSTGGSPKRVCEGCGIPTDVSPDGRTLVMAHAFPDAGSIVVLDLASGRQAEILNGHHRNQALWRAQLSPDGRWITFLASKWPGGEPSTHLFVAPFHDVVPIKDTEWTEVTNGESLVEAPQWSPSGDRLYFMSDRDGSRCLWSQRLERRTKKPDGQPIAVMHFHGEKHSMRDVSLQAFTLAVARDRLLFSLDDPEGTSW